MLIFARNYYGKRKQKTSSYSNVSFGYKHQIVSNLKAVSN
jgi:hypothetical protein